MFHFKIAGFFTAFILFSVIAAAQPKKGMKMNDVFFGYMQNKLELSVQEGDRMRPLVARYFNELKTIQLSSSDPLIREQKKIETKIAYREQFSQILGQERANRFFMEEQIFRKKIKEELKKRQNN